MLTLHVCCKIFSASNSVFLSIDNDDLLLSSAEDDQLIAKCVQCLDGVGEIWDSAAEQDLVLFLGGHLTVLVPHSLDCVDL
jgi:hypothetical protein